VKPRDYALRLRHRFSRRAVLIGAAQTGLFGLLLWRLRQLQILESPEYQLLSDDNRITAHLVAPARGAIYDRLGRTIAEDKENFRVIVIPALCNNLAATLDAISEIVPVSAADKDRVIRATRRQSGYFPVLVTEGIDWRQFALLSVLAPQIAGVRTDRATYRRYTRAASMAHVVGYVGLADKAEIGEHPVMRVPGFRTGKAGIEKGLDPDLRGQPGTISYEVDAHGRVVRELGATASVRGKDLALTIDQELQEIAHKRIEGLRVASIVVLDVATGGIVVMASYPSFDPNEVSFGRSCAGRRLRSTSIIP
jgi:penicillin-binding protein 2